MEMGCKSDHGLDLDQIQNIYRIEDDLQQKKTSKYQNANHTFPKS